MEKVWEQVKYCSENVKGQKMNKIEILKQYQAENVKIAPEFMSWMRSNHAGETGAVWIYKGASYVFWSKKIRLMAEEHTVVNRTMIIQLLWNI